MLHGAVPFRDLFSSQPPLYLWLLRAAFAVGGDTVVAGRALSTVAALAACGAVASIARRAGSARTAAAGALLCGLSPAFWRAARTCQAEAPALALATLGLALVASPRRALRPGWQVAAGALLGLALSTKLLVAPLLLPLLWWSGRCWAGRARGLLAALAVALAVAAPHGFGAVLREAVGLHLDALALPDGLSVGGIASRAWLPAAAALAGLAAPGRRRLRVGLALWCGASATFLLLHRPVFAHHLALLAPPLAAAAAVGLEALWRRAGPRPALAAAAALLLAVGVPGRPREAGATAAEQAALVFIVRSTGPEARIASDAQMLVFRAGRRSPPALVDTSRVRVASGSLDTTSALRAAGSAELVVLWNDRLAAVPGLLGWVRERCELVLPLPGADAPWRGVYRVRTPPGPG
jgi:4-amino-4-deoxy-L-arabinose transferase-like glycosyltransferase